MTTLRHKEHVDDILSTLETVEEETDVTFDVDREELSDWVQKFVDKRMEPDEGAQTIIKELVRDAGEDPYDYLGSSGGRRPTGATDHLHLDEIDEPGRWITVEGVVIDEERPEGSSVFQRGRIADDSGSVPFIIWETDDGDSPVGQALEYGESYQLEAVVTNYNSYSDWMEIKLRSNTQVTPLSGEDAFDIDPNEYTQSIAGSVVAFQNPMGLVDVCPNDDCGRVVNDRSHCPNCGDIDADLTLRTKFVLDDGQETWTVILDAEETKREANLTLEEAEKLAREHNSDDVVSQYIEAQLHGEYLRIEGLDRGRTFDPQSIELIEPPSIEQLQTISERLAELP